MDAVIYDKIEKEIKQTDYYMREKFFTSVSYIIFCFAVPITVWIVLVYDYIGWIVLATEIIIFGLLLHLWNFKIIREILQLCSSNKKIPLEELRRSDFFNLKKIKRVINTIEKQKPRIIDIIKKYGITTKDGLEEAIEHYRFKAIESKQIPINFLALFALAISIVSFFIGNDDFYENMSKVVVVLFLILIFLIYIVILYIYKAIFEKFSNKAFYTRIECALSEIRAMDKLLSCEESEINEDISAVE